MWTSLRRLGALLFTTLLLTATASAGDGLIAPGQVYDITHFDVLPVTSPFNSEQIAYAALFAYRDASKSDSGFKSFSGRQLASGFERYPSPGNTGS